MTRMKPNDDLHLYEMAVYKEQKISDYAGNPLIEALPPILESEDEVTDAFYNFPYISEEEKRLSPRLKSHLLYPQGASTTGSNDVSESWAILKKVSSEETRKQPC